MGPVANLSPDFFALTAHSHYEFLTDYSLNRREALKAPYIKAPNRASERRKMPPLRISATRFKRHYAFCIIRIT